MIRIFAFNQYYPWGGVTDLVPKAFLDVDSAKEFIEAKFKSGVIQDQFNGCDVHFQLVSDLVLTDVLAYGQLHVPSRGEPYLEWHDQDGIDNHMICSQKTEKWWQ